MIDRIKEFDLVYLATPYSNYPSGIHRAFVDTARIAARLMLAGVRIYSPICHTHPMAQFGNIDPLDHEIWMPFDEAMMKAASALLVAHMVSWSTSKGIRMEMNWFARAGKPILNLIPETLEVYDCHYTSK